MLDRVKAGIYLADTMNNEPTKQLKLKLSGPYGYWKPSLKRSMLEAIGAQEGDLLEIKVTKMGTKPVISIGKV